MKYLVEGIYGDAVVDVFRENKSDFDQDFYESILNEMILVDLADIVDIDEMERYAVEAGAWNWNYDDYEPVLDFAGDLEYDYCDLSRYPCDFAGFISFSNTCWAVTPVPPNTKTGVVERHVRKERFRNRL